MAVLSKPVVLALSAQIPVAVFSSPVVVAIQRLRADWPFIVAGGVVKKRIGTKCSVVGTAVEVHKGPITPSGVPVPKSFVPVAPWTGRSSCTRRSSHTCQTCRASGTNGPVGPVAPSVPFVAACTSRASCSRCSSRAGWAGWASRTWQRAASTRVGH